MSPSELSTLEAEILNAVNHLGWYADLWFPFVQREVLNFAAENPEEEVHAALVGLIRKGLLERIVATPAHGGLDVQTPKWQPSKEAFAAAKALLDRR
jgi:hypothetical protein